MTGKSDTKWLIRIMELSSQQGGYHNKKTRTGSIVKSQIGAFFLDSLEGITYVGGEALLTNWKIMATFKDVMWKSFFLYCKYK